MTTVNDAIADDSRPDPITVDSLRVLRKEQEDLAAACGLALGDAGFVFSDGETPPHPV